jgi:hypothetical protein
VTDGISRASTRSDLSGLVVASVTTADAHGQQTHESAESRHPEMPQQRGGHDPAELDALARQVRVPVV